MKYRKNSTNIFTILFGLMGFIILWIGSTIKYESNPDIERFIVLFLIALGLFFWGCVGIVWIVKKEAPQLVPLRGKSAVILGFILVISAWFWMLYSIYLIVIDFLR